MKMFNLVKYGYIFFVLIFIGFGFKINDDGDDFEIAKSFELFHDVVREIRLFYVDDPDISTLINESINEFLKKLDPYTVFYPESQIEEYSFITTGAYAGIGASVFEKNNQLILADVYQNSPADKAGLKTGDQIVAINNIKPDSSNYADIKPLLKGEPGSEVSLLIKRFGQEQAFEKQIIREKILFEDINYYELTDDDFAYIKLDGFKSGAANNVKKCLSELNSKRNLKGIILDLRGNPGGLLIEAVNLVNLFVEKGKEVVSTKGRIADWTEIYRATSEPIYPETPVVVLINRESASASEIVAGALQDYDRAVIIGQRSFGKGLVQTTRNLSYNTGIKITTAKYYIPSGRCIQEIDYSYYNNNETKNVKPFKTRIGRPVFEGGGIQPDSLIRADSLARFTKQIISNYLLFDFATEYYYLHPNIENPQNFKITDEIYKEFSEFVFKNASDLTSESYNLSNQLINSLKSERYDLEIINKIKSIKENILSDKKRFVQVYKAQIIPLLENELIGRYYYNSGQIKARMKHDKEYLAAKEILKNKGKYNLILSEISD